MANDAANVEVRIAFNPPLANLAQQFRDFKLGGALADEIRKIAFLVERYGKQLAPVDTGRLRASIGTSQLISELGMIVSTNVDYAFYVHDGTRYMRPRPFLETAANLISPALQGQIASRLDSEFTTAFKRL